MSVTGDDIQCHTERCSNIAHVHAFGHCRGNDNLPDTLASLICRPNGLVNGPAMLQRRDPFQRLGDAGSTTDQAESVGQDVVIDLQLQPQCVICFDQILDGICDLISQTGHENSLPVSNQ